jgi:hypothetical protein
MYAVDSGGLYHRENSGSQSSPGPSDNTLHPNRSSKRMSNSISDPIPLPPIGIESPEAGAIHRTRKESSAAASPLAGHLGTSTNSAISQSTASSSDSVITAGSPSGSTTELISSSPNPPYSARKSSTAAMLEHATLQLDRPAREDITRTEKPPKEVFGMVRHQVEKLKLSLETLAAGGSRDRVSDSLLFVISSNSLNLLTYFLFKIRNERVLESDLPCKFQFLPYRRVMQTPSRQRTAQR